MADLDVDARLVPTAIPSQDLSAGPLAFQHTPATDFKIAGIYLEADAALTGEQVDLTVNVSSGPIVFLSKATLNGQTDIVFRDDAGQRFRTGDQIRVNISNTTTPSVNVSGVLEVELV